MGNVYKTNQPPTHMRRFFAYAQQHGLELLPEDIKWITDSCKPFTPERTRELLMPYIKTWKKHMAAEPLEHKQQNAGRMQANLELLEKL